MPSRSEKHSSSRITAVDLFCGAGGLTRGLLDAGIRVTDGYDTDEACRFPYSQNNQPARFHASSVTELTGTQISKHYPKGHVRVLVGCAPCVTFSQYTQGIDHKQNPKWALLGEFARLVRELKPDIVSMENVPGLRHQSVYHSFLGTLKDEGFRFSEDSDTHLVYCPDYGIPQRRTRLVLLASRLGPIQLVPPTHCPNEYRTVHDALRTLPRLESGGASLHDPLHRAGGMSPLNLRRIRHSRPGGTWREWPPGLVAKCHKNKSGKSYSGVYGRMAWGAPSPTITTQFYGFGNGRFGHPDQDRALSLREGAILQSFPRWYQFSAPGGSYSFEAIGRLIGNAVPVRLGTIIGRTIKRHVEEYGD